MSALAKMIVLRDRSGTLERVRRERRGPLDGAETLDSLLRFDANPGPSARRGGDRRSAAPGTSAPTIEPDALEIEVAETSASERREIRRDPSVLVSAQTMPLALVRNVDDARLATHERHSDADDLADVSVAWGIEAVGADESLADGSNTVVAVLDTGIDATHPAFVADDLRLVRRNFTAGSDDDEDGHGTHCAGTIFGRDVDGTRIGVARGVRKALIAKVIGSGAGTDALLQALGWAVDQGADIISMSLGFNFPQFQDDLVADGVPPLAATSIALQAYRDNVRLFDRWMDFNRAKAASGRSALVVAAAGNESQRGGQPDFEIGTSSPASAQGIVSVGALAQGGGGLSVASFSNTGPQISGPGVSVLSARSGGGLVALNGTSMACPHVAGVAALIWDDMLNSPIRPNPERVAARLEASAEHAGLFLPDVDFTDIGVGICRAP